MREYQTYRDEQLLVLLKEADQQAFEELYSRYWKKLFTLAFHKLQSKQDAEDIVHDIFASIWIRRSELDIQSLEAYLAVAVKYKILSYLDKAVRQMVPISEESSVVIGDALASDKIDHQVLSDLIGQQIHLLPEKCRIVFVQSRIAGKSNPEIARDLNISRKTVEKHISTALRHLRLSLKDFLSCFFFY